jgi:two-component system response regulator PhoP
MRCLLAEDDPQISENLSHGLREAGYTVDAVFDGREAIFFASEFSYEVAIVDLGLPVCDGMEVIKAIRASEVVLPIIVLTARTQVAQVVAALEAGADDYLKKPIEVPEVLAHIDAVLRRASVANHRLDPVMRYSFYELDVRRRELKMEGSLVDLTTAEMAILEKLWKNAGRVLSKREIAESYQKDPDVETSANSVEGLVGRLKKKCLDKAAGSGLPIKTVRGQGYLFDDSEDL